MPPRDRQPLREQRFRFLTIAIAGAVGITIVYVVQAIGHHRPISPIALLIAVPFALVIGVPGILIGQRIGRGIVGDRIEVAFREPGTTKWRHGRLTISPGQVTLERYRWQVRIPSGDRREYGVTGLDDTGQRPSLRQIMSVNPQLHIAVLHTTAGDLELAAFPSRITELQRRLGEPGTGS
ncbi:hypothetical protein QDR37_00395 [Amnibacterium sp. CER49]|uniref:hypothetical protein n=1 Tax=Amnibacterium sp. CER49 TaxID=3039161 RepID=UPI00244B54B7|nr:hypothetical protein [Amnibacterium sp. CER49]MDH2442396.1 hypothetical protein [Amnibacterium sp. CER49]